MFKKLPVGINWGVAWHSG